MIKFVKGNFFDFDADIMINTVNCVGVMGAGAALQFKTKFPKMFKDYALACSKGEVKIGKGHIWKEDNMFKSLTIINFPTKDHWKNPSEYIFIEKGLTWLKEILQSYNNLTVTVPALGCGHGGLDWSIVKELIKKELSDSNNTILVFEPKSSTKINLSKEINDLLIKNNINRISPNDNIYPKKIKGRSSKEIYFKGNTELLLKKNIAIVVTSKPEEREKKALELFIDALPNNDFVFLMGFSNSYEIDIVKKILDRGFKTILVLPFGILNLKVRKDLKESWSFKNILVASITNPNDSWKSYESINALKFRIKISDIILINSLNFDKLKMFNNELESNDSKKFFLNYWNNNIDFYKNISAEKIGINPKTNKPNTTKVLEALK
ncbi:macro domain-containing protein [Winogradskyella sp. MH6]|uniref:macro domain-containing protein n=1 Tax=Winogradskyella sp. MH6 TaxID=2929510 RepID=UPI001FB51EB1|nr:macro domain-containing protein [Winogradskyella sp. MH6]